VVCANLAPDMPILLTRRPVFRLLAPLVLAAAACAAAQQAEVSPDLTNGVYQVGDTVRWSVVWQGASNAPAARYTCKRDGFTETSHGTLSFSNNVAVLETKFDAPGAMLVEVTWPPDSPANRAVGGAVAAPEKISPSAPPPDDFDAFWQRQLERLNEVPAHPQLEQVDIAKPGVLYWKVTLDHVNHTRIHGQIARPEKGGKLPALLLLQWAGVYPLRPEWITGYAASGWLALDIEAHDIPIDKPDSFCDQLRAGPLKDYWRIGNDDREASYFLQMYLSAVQALEYLMTRPDWDGKTLVVMGTSQGGQQTLMLAGLHPKNITAALALVPSGCDMLAPAAGRAPAFPTWYFNTSGKDADKVRETSRYFDVVNFARRIECPVLIGIGLRDEVCPPATVLAAATMISSPKEILLLPKSGHQDEHGTQSLFDKRKHEVWLPLLFSGKPLAGAINPL
jgi:cephalosporin-C deacetylase-like acetyl esterase